MTDIHDPLRSPGRRRALQLLGGAGLAALAACAGTAGGGASTATTASSSGQGPGGAAGAGGAPSGGSPSVASADGAIPEETAGPYPGDGSNGPDVLDDDGIVRRDITASYGSSSAVAAGVPLTLRLTVLDAASGDPRRGAAVYAWHCDREGRYSQYAAGLEDENSLRGVQAAGDDGVVTFTSIFPGAYSGRWPHVHFEVYASQGEATGDGTPIATSQLALPEDACDAVYASEGYEQSVANMRRLSLASDMVFGDDGAVHQMASVSGSVDGGLTAALEVPV